MRPNPQDAEAPKKAYATPREKENLDLDAFAEHITSHGSVYSKGDILAILTIAVSCIKEQLLEGNSVTLGDLGKFSVSFNCRGAVDYDSFTSQGNIKKVKPQWTPAAGMRNLKDEANFNRVLTKKDEDEAKKEAYNK